MINSKITAIGSYVPEKVLTNADLEKMVETSDEWIRKRTGIIERRVVTDDTTLTMATKAGLDLQKRFNIDLSDVDFIIFASSTTEQRVPSMASQLQYELKVGNCGTIDLTAACAGFIYGLNMAKSMISTGMHKKILVVAGEVLTKHTDYKDRATCILFGDGASVCLVEPTEEGEFYKPVYGTEGEFGHVLYISNTTDTLNSKPINNNDMIWQDGNKVFKWAIQRMTKKSKELLEINNLTIDDIDWFIPHSANQRIIDAICDNIKIGKEKTLESVKMYGNTSAVSIPLALDNAVRENKIKKNDKVLMIGFGGGLTYSGTIIDW